MDFTGQFCPHEVMTNFGDRFYLQLDNHMICSSAGMGSVERLVQLFNFRGKETGV